MTKKGGDEEQQVGLDPWVLEDAYPEPQTIFSAHTTPPISDDSVIVALDTNALLLPYRITPVNLKALGKVYKDLSDKKRLVIPGRTAREFAKHRDTKLGEMVQALNEHRRRFPPDQLPPLVEGMVGYEDAMKHLNDLKSIKQGYEKAVGRIIDGMKEWRGNDPVATLYAEVFKPETIIELPVADLSDRASLLKEADHRTRNRVPPGYKDANKDDQGIGDYLIWKSLLQVGKERKQDLAFVTGEQKSDWFIRSTGEHIYPRFELVDEYRRASGGRSLRLMSLPQLLDQLKAPPEVVKDVKTAEEQSNRLPSKTLGNSPLDNWRFVKIDDKIFVVPSQGQAGTAPIEIPTSWANTFNFLKVLATSTKLEQNAKSSASEEIGSEGSEPTGD